MAKKMVLMDPSNLLLKTSPVPDTLSNDVLTIDNEMKSILESTDMSENERVLAYQQALRRYLTKVDQVNERLKVKRDFLQSSEILDKSSPSFQDNTDKRLNFEKRMIESIPKTLQKKAKILLDHIKDTSDLTWNERGEITLNDETVNQSNVSDLIHEALRARKLSSEPIGWSVFSKMLRDTNVPLELIGNKSRWYNTTEQTGLNEVETPPATPRRKKKNRNSDNQVETPIKSNRKKKKSTSKIAEEWLEFSNGRKRK